MCRTSANTCKKETTFSCEDKSLFLHFLNIINGVGKNQPSDMLIGGISMDCDAGGKMT